MPEQMESSELAMLELACHSAQLGSWRLEPETETLVLSPTLCRLLRISSDEELRLPHSTFCSQYVHPEDSWYVRDFQSRPPAQKYSFRVICEDGSGRWLESFPVQQTSASAAEKSISGVVQDITERIVSEDSLRNARKMESIRSIAGGIAHEFNNILYSLSGYVGLLKDVLGAANELNVGELKEYVGEIEESSRRAVRLIKKIQTFSHSGKQGITSVNLESAVKKALQQMTLPDNVDCRLMGSPASPVCAYVNETILVESLANIINNGVAAMQKSGGTLAIDFGTVFEAENRPVSCGAIKTGYYGWISICDGGNGMDKNTISRIFEPFFTTRQAGQGTGLGLAIVYGMVNAAGGAVEVESQPGKGTTFRLLLPACSNHAQGVNVQ